MSGVWAWMSRDDVVLTVVVVSLVLNAIALAHTATREARRG